MADNKTPTLKIPHSGFTSGEVWVEPGHQVVVTYRYSDQAMVKQVSKEASEALGRFVDVDDAQEPGRLRLHIVLTPH